MSETDDNKSSIQEDDRKMVVATVASRRALNENGSN